MTATDPGRTPHGAERRDDRRGGAWKWLIIALIVVALLIAGFFAFFGVDADTEGELDVDVETPETDVDVDAPDVDAEAPDVDVDPGSVDVDEDEADAEAGTP